MKIIQNIPDIELCNITEYTGPEIAIVLTTPKAESMVGLFLKKINVKTIIYIQSSEKKEVDKIANRNIKAEIVYAIGGGRVMDIGRYLASCWGLKIICIPTIISSDAFLVNCTGLRENGCVTYVPSKRADRVLLDWGLLKKVSLKYHLSGCGDILSIYTGVYDWKYANKRGIVSPDESYSRSVAIMAKGILDSLLSETEEIRKGTKKGLETLITCLGMEVELCNFYGNSRPEEGGEHFFAYCIENKTSHFLHGEIVGLGILITSFLQERNWRKIKDFMDEVNLNYKPAVINKQVVLATLQEIKNYVKKHKLRYTIYNEFDYRVKKSKIDKFLNILGIKD